MYASKDFVDFVDLIRNAQEPADILAAWNILESPYSSLRVITSLPNYRRNVSLPGTDIRDLSGKIIVTPYFLGESLYFSSRKIIEKTITEREIQIPLNGSIMLDTNIASYISTYVYRKPFSNNQAEIVNLIHQLLEKRPDYNYIYYVVENSKEFINKNDVDYRPNFEQLWADLHPDFKANLVALKLFLSIDQQKFKQSRDDSPTISSVEAEHQAKELIHSFYFGTGDSTILKDIKRRFTYARILLYKMAAINFDSNEGFKKKSTKFVQFMIDELRMYFDREMHVAVRYFKDGKKFSFFEKLDKGKHIKLDAVKEKIANMAWDLMIPRVVESLSAKTDEGQFFIPYYLTWDGGLKESLNMYKAKACIFDDSQRRLITIPEVDNGKFLQETVGDYHTNRYFDSATVAKRYGAAKMTDEELIVVLENTEKELLSVIHK